MSIQLVLFDNTLANLLLLIMAVVAIMRMAAYVKNMIPFI